MASRRSKRKSPCQDTIFFEVNDNDLSPEHHSHEDSEPEMKIMKKDTVLGEKILEFFSMTEDSVVDSALDTKLDISCEKPENSLCENNPEFTESNNINEETSTTQCNVGEDKEATEVIKIKQNITNSNTPVDSQIHISFGNKELADLYKIKLIKFFESFVELEIIKETDLGITFQRDPLLNCSDWIVLDETFCSSQNSEDTAHDDLPSTPSKSKKKKAKKKKKDDDLFVLDTNPSHNESVSLNTKYLSKFQIEIEQKDEDNDTPIRTALSQNCFNCNENHSLRDCPLPRVQARINAARNKFKANKQTMRYHLEEDQKYGHFSPGKISPSLREALGLRKNQLPPYIYRMRVLGYPPGWLEEAKFVYSNLDMFDAEGKTVREKSMTKKQGLNPEKIVEYPGFNTPSEQNFKDEYKYYDVPPFSDHFKKEAMINYFEKQYANQQDNYETCEMDIDASENGTAEKISSDNPRMKELKGTTEDVPSPSLIELEKQKEKLLLALEDNTSSNIISEENTCEEPEATSVSKDDANDTESQDDSIQLTSVDDCIDLENSTDEGISDSEKSMINTSIKNSSFGTPILQSKSPYSRLPKMDNFTKDVSPVINFENLPNATGKYEQMTEVLQKVRNKMKNLQNCKSLT